MSQNRIKIPESIKRAVRKRCGFGCVICGMQPYDYEHIIEYATVKEHTEENLTLLCSNHHAEKTRKNIQHIDLIEFNKTPYNLTNKMSKSRYLYYSSRDGIEVDIGGNIFKYDNLEDGFEFVPLQIDGKNIISFVMEDNRLFLNFISYNLDNNLVIEIAKNEIIHSTGLWDAEWKGMKFILRSKLGEYLLQLEFRTPNKLKISKGIIHYNDTDIILDNNILFIANNKTVMSNNNSVNCKVGLSISGMKKYAESFNEVKKYFRRSKKELLKHSHKSGSK